MKKIFKKIMNSTLSIAIILSSFAPLTVMADGTYDIIVTLDDGYTAEADGSKLNVYRPNEQEAHFTEARDVSNDQPVGVASCTDNTHCKITVSDTITTTFNTSEPVFFGDNHFDMSTEINQNTSLSIRLDNNNNNNNNQQQNNVVVHLDGATISGNTITFNVDSTSIPVTINANMNATYNINGMDVSIPETDKYNVKFQLPSNFDRQKYEVYALVGDNSSVVPLSGDDDFSVGDYNEDLHLGIRLVNNNNNNNEPGPIEPNFDGKAYILWSCKSGGICMKHFDNIPDFNDGNSTFYKDTSIEDDRTRETFDINAKYKGWSTDAKFNNWVAAYKIYKGLGEEDVIDWSTVNPKDMLGDPIDMREFEDEAIEAGTCTKNEPQDVFEDCVNTYVASKGLWVARAQLQPLPDEPDDNNAYVSYGDRNFKVVIYNDKYKGITIGDLSDLNYYPSSWANPFIRQDQYDISDTTKAKNTTVNAILLEKTLNIKEVEDEDGEKINGFEITKLEALDVPSDAVSISKVNGEWKLVFSSNFYDSVVFKATDKNGEVSYFTVKRYIADPWINNIDNKPHLYTELYFDKNNSYTDFNLTAKIEYKDGTVENVKLTPYNKIDDGLGNPTYAYEVDESNPEYGPSGKGLKKSVFIYKLKDGTKSDRDVKRAYVNVEYKGSTSKKYAGALAGSGKGILANIYKEEEE